jgi:hypothetical protein
MTLADEPVMEWLPAFGTDELQRHPSRVRDRLLPGAGGRWVNKVTGEHYGYLTVDKPGGYEVERVSCHQFATRIGQVRRQVSWGDTFEVRDGRRDEPLFYVTLSPSNEVARADQATRWETRRHEGTGVRTRVHEMLANEVIAREVVP